MKLLRELLAGSGGVFVDGFGVLARHWPQLVVLYLFGAAGRMGLLWLAVEVSEWSPTVGLFIMPLAPLSTLLSLVLMLRVMAETLPAFSDFFAQLPALTRWRDNLSVAVTVLLPFLALYAAQGLLIEDQRMYLYDTTIDDYLTKVQPTFVRTVYADGPVLIGLVVGALVVRKIITLRDLRKKSMAIAAFATYLEVLWMVTLSHVLASQLDLVREWVANRAVVAGLVEWWQATVLSVQQATAFITDPFAWVTKLLAAAKDLVVVPVAWLAMGAAVYGAELKQGPEIVPREEVERRLKRIPNPVKRVVGEVVEPVTSPIKDTLGALGKVATAGILPMVLFCIVFVVAGQVKVLTAWAGRAVIGATDGLTRTALSPYFQLAERGVYFVLTLALLAAAVNRVVSAQRRAEAQAAAEAQPSGSTA